MFSASEKSVLIDQIEQNCGLQFLNGNSLGNLCFRNNNEEMRVEFRQLFTDVDLLNFLKNFQHKNIEVPDDSLTFWSLVEKGKKIA